MGDPVSLMLMAAGSALSAGSTIAHGYAQNEEAKFRAQQLRAEAAQARALGQRRAFEERRKGDLGLSALQARAAASGGGASDPTILQVASDLAGRGELAAGLHRSQGENRARGLMGQAAASLAVGRAARNRAIMSGTGSILSRAGGLARKFAALEADDPLSEYDDTGV